MADDCLTSKPIGVEWTKAHPVFPHAERERRLWLGVRRALFIVIQAIEERYDMPITKSQRQ